MTVTVMTTVLQLKDFGLILVYHNEIFMGHPVVLVLFYAFRLH